MHPLQSNSVKVYAHAAMYAIESSFHNSSVMSRGSVTSAVMSSILYAVSRRHAIDASFKVVLRSLPFRLIVIRVFFVLSLSLAAGPAVLVPVQDIQLSRPSHLTFSRRCLGSIAQMSSTI